MFYNNRFPISFPLITHDFSELYYASSGNQFYGELSGNPVDTSVRPLNTVQNITFTNFKYSAGVSRLARSVQVVEDRKAV